MVITCHWSATSPDRIRDYHVEFGLKMPLDGILLHNVRQATKPSAIDFERLFFFFNVWKNFDLTAATDYGTWRLNHDPRDGSSPDIEIGALCMGGEGTSTTQWGRWPYTKAHAWMHAAIIARVCRLKGINPQEHFSPTAGLQDGPIFTVSTHAERAYQTINPGIDDSNHRGYGMFSGDPDTRWDLAVFEQSDSGKLIDYPHARQATHDSAQWLRDTAAAIMAQLGSDPNMIGLDKAST